MNPVLSLFTFFLLSKGIEAQNDYYYCSDPLVYYSSLSASSHLPTREPSKAVLDGDFAWTAGKNDFNQFLSIEFDKPFRFTKIITQGKSNSKDYVSQYIVQYSSDGQSWKEYKLNGGLTKAFDGNLDGNSKKENGFTTPIIGRYLRILPLRWGIRIGMRVEVYGCEYERETAYFNGKSMIQLDYSLVPIASHQDTIRLRFKTEDPDGVLLYSKGSQGDYVALQLRHNRMVFNLDLGSKLMTSLSVGSLLDDNSWHDVEVIRRHRNVSLLVDRVRVDDIIKGDFKRLDLNKQLFIGGVPTPLQDGLRTRLNFTGCLENLFINGTSTIKKLNSGGGGSYYGEPEYSKYNIKAECPFGYSSHLTISMNELGAYLRFPAREGDVAVNVSLEFRTYESEATLVYHSFGNEGFFKVFLENGRVKVEIKARGTPGEILLDNFDVTYNDGRWHRVMFAVSKNSMELVVNEIPMKTTRLIEISAGRFFYIGGKGKDSPDIPSFLGCMRRISVSGFPRRPKDEEIFPSKSSVVIAACQLLDRCNPNPCEHGGRCKQSSRGFSCDCTGTGYSGSVCHASLNPVSCRAFGNQNPGTKRAEVYIDVDGSGHLDPFPVTCEFFNDGRVTSSVGHKHNTATTVDGFEERGSFVQEIQYDANKDQIEVFLNRSRLCRQQLFFECVRVKLFNSPYSLTDEFLPNTWWVSRQNQMMDYWGGSLPGSKKCECGLMGNCINKDKWCNCDTDLDVQQTDRGDLTVKEHLPVREVRVGGTGTHLDGRKAKISVGPLICEGDNIFDNVVTFRKQDANLELPRFDMGLSGDIYFEFKTTARDGCMIYAEGPQDFIKVCIVGGQALQFQYEAGGGPQSVTVTTANVLNDDEWHSVLVERNRKGGSLTVDHSTHSESLEPSGAVRAIYLNSKFIVGSTIDFRDGYVGCIRAMILNGELQDLRGRAEREQIYGVGGGCKGKCFSNPCMNNGTCHEGYAHYDCDCRWTAFKGPICADEIGIKMLTDTMVKYELPGTYKSTVAEDIRIGFTTTDPRGFLIGLVSKISGEYLTLAVSNSGHLKVTFDFGFERHEQVYGARTFHEGQNHNVRLWRSGSGRKLHMQVDDYEPATWTYNVKASDDAQFNNIQYLYVGKNESMAEGFRGCITRVSFDDIYPLKLLFQQDKPKNIVVESSSTVQEDYCGIEPFRYAEEQIETRPPLNISDSVRRDLYPFDTAALIGGILFVLILALLLMGCIIGRYVARHKGDYQTHEAEGADLAPDADWAVQHGRTGPQVKRNTEMYI